MTDYTDLQKAAAYAAQDAIKFADESEEMRALQKFHEEVDPEPVLALIAEIDKIDEDRKACWAEFKVQGRMMDEIKAENEALRKERDGRHPLKPFHEPAIGFTGCVICGMYTDHGGLPCPKTRATADAVVGQEMIWCACGDGYPVNSHGAGFMDANNGVCANCDSANQGAEPDLDAPNALAVLRKALSDLLALYDEDEGCRNLPQYIAGRAALGQGEQS